MYEIILNTLLGFTLLVVSWRSTAFKGHHFWHIAVAALVMGVAILNGCNLNIKNAEIKELNYQIAASDKKLDSLLTVNVSLKNGQGSLNKQHIESQTRIDELKELLQMKDQRIHELEKLLPRELNDSQKNLLLSSMKGTNMRLEIYTKNMEPETISFAKQLINVFIVADCEVEHDFNRIAVPNSPGLNIQCGKKEYNNAKILGSALQRIGYKPNRITTTANIDDSIQLWIGPKPVN
jgi:outer membrane lipopolysaccharide assembly protein LptE/RlpB